MTSPMILAAVLQPKLGRGPGTFSGHACRRGPHSLADRRTCPVINRGGEVQHAHQHIRHRSVVHHFLVATILNGR
ncbi:hypothetical protein J6590_045780 [Homalodisca vitripennis]|nr:hypothetical protein J6590_045780 [Homalodisca vitripennis]